MTQEERQQSLTAARRAAWKIAEYAVREMDADDPTRMDIECLFAEFTRLDKIEQVQAKAGKKHGHLGAEYGKLGGRPRGTTKKTTKKRGKK